MGLLTWLSRITRLSRKGKLMANYTWTVRLEDYRQFNDGTGPSQSGHRLWLSLLQNNRRYQSFNLILPFGTTRGQAAQAVRDLVGPIVAAAESEAPLFTYKEEMDVTP